MFLWWSGCKPDIAADMSGHGRDIWNRVQNFSPFSKIHLFFPYTNKGKWKAIFHFPFLLNFPCNQMNFYSISSTILRFRIRYCKHDSWDIITFSLLEKLISLLTTLLMPYEVGYFIIGLYHVRKSGTFFARHEIGQLRTLLGHAKYHHHSSFPT